MLSIALWRTCCNPLFFPAVYKGKKGGRLLCFTCPSLKRYHRKTHPVKSASFVDCLASREGAGQEIQGRWFGTTWKKTDILVATGKESGCG
jgi:hypothetical protein